MQVEVEMEADLIETEGIDTGLIETGAIETGALFSRLGGGVGAGVGAGAGTAATRAMMLQSRKNNVGILMLNAVSGSGVFYANSWSCQEAKSEFRTW